VPVLEDERARRSEARSATQGTDDSVFGVVELQSVSGVGEFRCAGCFGPGRRECIRSAFGPVRPGFRRLGEWKTVADERLPVPAILRYIEEIHPQKPLHGETAKERALKSSTVVSAMEAALEIPAFATRMSRRSPMMARTRSASR
jgi:hypothetical protein